MSQKDKELEKEFAAYERDLPINEIVQPSNDDMDFSEMDYELPKPTEPKPQEQPEPPAAIPEEPVEELTAVEEPPVINEPPPRHVHPPLNTDDMTRLSMKLGEAVDAIIPLRYQTSRMVKDHDDIRLPKGLRTAKTNLHDISDILVATKALVDIYLEMGVEPLYQSVDDSSLKTMAGNTANTLLSHIPTMQEGLNDIEASMAEGYDRPSANLRMRIVKAQTKVVKTNALEQVKALVKTIDAFPLEYGSLRLLCLFHEKDDSEVNHAIDHALRLGEAVQVPVADAPAMLQAVQKNDQKAVDAIVNRMIQNS